MKISPGLPVFIAAALISLSATMTLTACSSSSNGSGGMPPTEPPALKAMPDQIQIDTQTLAPVSDQEASDGKTLFKALMVAHALQKQILIPDDESAREKSDRQAEFTKLTDDQKSAVQSITSRCKIVENPSSKRSSLTFKESIQTSGSQCPADLQRATILTYTVQSSDAQGTTGSASINGSLQLVQNYKESALAQAAQTQHTEIQGTYLGLTQISRSGSKTYFQITATGAAQLMAAGPVQLSLKAESLGGEDSREMVYYLRLTAQGHDYNYAAHCLAGPDRIETLEFYSGDHKLSDKETAESGAENLIRQF